MARSVLGTADTAEQALVGHSFCWREALHKTLTLCAACCLQEMCTRLVTQQQLCHEQEEELGSLRCVYGPWGLAAGYGCAGHKQLPSSAGSFPVLPLQVQAAPSGAVCRRGGQGGREQQRVHPNPPAPLGQRPN